MSVPALDRELAAAAAADVHVRLQVVGQVLVRGGAQDADPGPRRQPAEVERQHLRQRPVEQGGELVAEERPSSVVIRHSEGVSEPEAGAFAVAELGGGAEHQPRLGEPTGGQRGEPVVHRTGQRVHERHVRQRQRVHVHRVQLLADRPHQRRLPGARRPGDEHHVPRPHVEHEVRGDRVRLPVRGDPEQVADVRRRQAPPHRPHRVADGDGGQHGIALTARLSRLVKLLANREIEGTLVNMRVDKEILSPDDLRHLVDGDLYEFVSGMPVEKHMGAESDWIGATLIGLLWSYCHPQQLGLVFGPQTGFRCFPRDRNLLRKPDVSFIARGRLPGDRPPKGDLSIPPDLAVEVVSPNDTYPEVARKIRDYLSAGIRLVWVIDPDTRTVHIHRLDGTSAVLTEADALSGEDVVPGFACRVGELFA